MTIKPQEYAARRRKLLKKIGPDAIAVLAAAKPSARSRDLEYPFRQNSDFLYLTGLNEPYAAAALMPQRQEGEFVLFCRQTDASRAVWEGRSVGPEEALSGYGADQAFAVDKFNEVFPELLGARGKIFTSFEGDGKLINKLFALATGRGISNRYGNKAFTEMVAIDEIVHEMRLIKSRGEIDLMRRAIDISVAAHYMAMQVSRSGENESAAAATLIHEFVRNHACEAYPCIVGGGPNACVLHYFKNNEVMAKNTLTLIDAGAEYEGYAADITRTFPVDGRFKPRQKALYEVALEAQEAAIKKVTPGNSWNEPHDAATRALSKGLISLGILSGPLRQVLKKRSYEEFYMHKTGHWLGLDVHDVGSYKVAGKWRPFKRGMTLTVEPGLYLRNVKGWQDMGVRVEDDVLVTATGNEVLSDKLVRKPEAIEEYMAAFRD